MRIKHLLYFVTFCYSFVSYSQTISIYKITNVLTIDGDLSDWTTPFTGPFVIHNSGLIAHQLTYVSFSWDSENLYLAYRCSDSKIIGSPKNHDTAIFNTDDLVEIFIDPDSDGLNYLEIGVNAYSSNYDMLIYCSAKSCGGWNTSIASDILKMETISKITDEGYSVEIKIPFSSLNSIKDSGFKIPTIGTKWKGNVFRIDYGNQTEYQAVTAYNGSEFGFHQPAQFKTFEFKDIQ